MVPDFFLASVGLLLGDVEKLSGMKGLGELGTLPRDRLIIFCHFTCGLKWRNELCSKSFLKALWWAWQFGLVIIIAPLRSQSALEEAIRLAGGGTVSVEVMAKGKGSLADVWTCV